MCVHVYKITYEYILQYIWRPKLEFLKIDIRWLSVVWFRFLI
jgi:hypothetical protein